MERKGKAFQFYPSVGDTGVEYSWPDDSYEELFQERKKEFGEPLLNKFRSYIGEFELFTHVPYYPYLQKGERGLCLHLGDGGRWIEVWPMIGDYFIGCHNLNSSLERVVAFNIGADTLEFLDEEIKAPRIRREGNLYFVNYPIAENLVPSLPEGTFEKSFELAKLGGVEIIKSNDHHEFRTEYGSIYFKKDVVEGNGFNRLKILGATWIISRLMNNFLEEK